MAFLRCSSLKEIELPSTIKNIDPSSFPNETKIYYI